MSQPIDGISLEEFKRYATEFAKESETLSENDLDAGYRAVTKGYLGIPSDKLTLMLAKGYLEFATRAYMKRKNVLEYGHDPMETLKGLVGMR